jgi:hypothetical protein
MHSKPSQLIGRVSDIPVVFPAGMDHCIRAMDVLGPHVFRAGGLVVQVGRDGSQGQ